MTTTKTPPRNLTIAEWHAEAKRRFGEDRWEWRWICPACGIEISTRQYHDAGAPESVIAFNCVGRYIEGTKPWLEDGPASQPCDYTGGGFIGLNPVAVDCGDGKTISVFEFAGEDPGESQNAAPSDG